MAVVQGTLGGLMFWWLALPAPLLWGVVMGLLAIVPVLGAFVVWVPVAVFLALDGEWVQAMLLTAWGAVVVGALDHVEAVRDQPATPRYHRDPESRSADGPVPQASWSLFQLSKPRDPWAGGIIDIA